MMSILVVYMCIEIQDSKHRYGAAYQSPYAMVGKKIGEKLLNELLCGLSDNKISNFIRCLS